MCPHFSWTFFIGSHFALFLRCLFHLYCLSPFPDHLRVGVHVLVGRFHGLIEGGEVPTVLFDELFCVLLLLEGPFGPFRHHSHLVTTNDPNRLFGIDQLMRVVISHLDGLRRIVKLEARLIAAQ